MTRGRTWTRTAALVGSAWLLAATAVADEGAMGGPPPAPAPAPGEGVSRPADPAPGEDVLVLKDGREIRGRITAEDDAGYAVKVGGSLRVVAKDEVKEVRRGPRAPEAPPAPAEGEGGKKRRKYAEAGAPMPPDGGAPAEPPPPLSADGAAWAKACIERLLGPGEPAVHRSAAEALRALGPAVLPVLKEASAAADPEGKARLERLVGAIAKGPPKGMPPGLAGKGPEGKRPEGAPGAPKGPAPGRGPALLERVKNELGLDEGQAMSVGAELLKLGRDTREILQDARDGLITYEDARTKASTLRSALRDTLKDRITPEQMTKLDGILDEMARRMAGGPPPGKKPEGAPPAPPPGGPPPGGDGAPPK